MHSVVTSPPIVAGKRILFIGRNFFGYDLVIRSRLEELGASVDYVADVPYKNNLSKAALRVARPILIRDSTRRILHQVSLFQRGFYDYVLCVIGEGISCKGLVELRKAFPTASFHLHIWDGIDNNRKGLVSSFDHFDDISSFDPTDARRFRLRFRPLFFSRPYESPGARESALVTLDMSFVGTAHSDRAGLISHLRRDFSRRNRTCFFFQYLQAKWLYYAYNFYDGRYAGIPIAEFSFSPLSQLDSSAIMKKSRVILDIPHPKQAGLTIRTIECLGLGLKLATTNQTIVDYDFFCAENIVILDKKNLVVGDDFIDTPPLALPTQIREKYSLDSWLKDVLLLH